MPTLQYPKSPNTDTAFVVQDDGTKNRALMIAPQDTSTLELPSNPNSTKGYVTIDGKKQRVVLTADITGGGGDQHNLGWYATESALTTAHPTAEAGDWAIVGATDTVWIWDTDNSQWVDSDQKGQVTSVNNQTGAVTITGADILPTQTDNAGKFLVTNGTSASWSNEIKSTDANVSAILTLKSQNNDYAQFYKRNSTTTNLFGVSVYKNNTHLSGIDFNNTSVVISHNNVGFYFSGTNNSFYSNKTGISLGMSSKIWANVYTNKLNNGSDITVPAVGGEMAVKSVNTTITIAVADWNGGTTATKSVTGITTTGIVLVSPDPSDTTDYVAAGILCTSQTTNSLTFTCDTTPTSDIDVVVVQL